MKHKSAFLTGIALFLCFCMLIARGKLGGMLDGSILIMVLLLAEAAAFLLPAVFMLLLLRPIVRIPLTVKQLRPTMVHLAVRLGIAVSLASFLLHLLVVWLAGQDVSVTNLAVFQGSDIGSHTLLYILAFALIPALVEEIFLRGVVLQVMMRYAGTGLSIVLTAAIFAMLHGSVYNLIGPFLSGLAFGWLAYTCGSVLPAVIAHAAHNLCELFVLWLTETYSAFGIWNHLPAVCALFVLLFSYFALRSAERLFLRGQVPHFVRGEPAVIALRKVLGNPASIAFVAAFFAKTIFGVI